MRLIRLFGILMIVCSAMLGYGQVAYSDTQPGDHDLSKSVHLWPNPAVEYVHVKLDQVPASKVKLTIHNIIGNKMDIETEVVDEHELRVKIKDLASGYYLLAIKQEGSQNTGTFKFLKRD
jgi:hypothetical protein